MDRKSFLDEEAPAGYVAGVGRGATGFTTRADIGNGRLQSGNFSVVGNEGDEVEQDGRFNDAVEDSEIGLLKSRNADEDDDDADRIYEEIENRLKQRRKRKFKDENDEKKDLEQENEVNLISEQFQDLKEALSTVSGDQWANLPEVGDLTKKNKRQRKLLQQQQRFYAVPDTVLTGLTSSNQLNDTLEDDDNANNSENDENDHKTNFRSIALAKDKLLGLKLDSSNALMKSVNSTDYLKFLESPNNSLSTKNVGDIKKARLILSNLRKNEPNKPSAWIASARLEEQTKKFSLARSIIQEGCENCPLNDDIWLENIRLNRSDIISCKKIIRQALEFNSNSIKLWLEACQLETDPFSAKRVLRKGLEKIPTSIELWKRAVDLEDDVENAKKLLNKAVELIPNSIELWITLINLEKDFSQCKKFLNDARKANPSSVEIWIYAAKLEEKNTANEIKINKLLKKGITELISKHHCELTRDDWIREAIDCEVAGYDLTCNGIIQSTFDFQLDDYDFDEKLKILKKDADMALKQNFIETSRAMYRYILENYQKDIATWHSYIDLERNHGSLMDLYLVLEDAIAKNPNYEIFWLMYAKAKWMNGDINEARKILDDAFKKLPNNEDIWLASIKLENSTQNIDKCLEYFEKAKDVVGSERIYYKYITFQRAYNNEKALELVEEGLEKFPTCDKLHMQKGQILQDLGKNEEAREAFKIGVNNCKKSIPLWLLLSRLEEFKFKSSIRSRAVLDKALTINADSTLIWREMIRLERRNKNLSQSRIILSKALKKFPHSPELWCENLLLIEKQSQKRTMFKDAMIHTNDHPLVLLTIGYILWFDGKFLRAKLFFDKAIELDKDNGDSWCWLYLFLTRHGDPEEINDLIKELIKADPHHGEKWCEIRKKIENMNKSPKEILELVSEKLVEKTN
ncbi:hypothetical protein PACTADRAFT_48466 [Pachysolen tannophilus NRRL Y-2460]|uniref:PRP1 splicing factor N-terminal domain-containing protein n=1 Tax=Pachysolen tannophilus NRRL Y-2460 TaxID=669874 RepID=A0A1E4TY03_PACTA|nr:hypothetical protein PACTADRAFT_48466 [Pachysolen tannophilus NRRL Y-2460]